MVVPIVVQCCWVCFVVMVLVVVCCTVLAWLMVGLIVAGAMGCLLLLLAWVRAMVFM